MPSSCAAAAAAVVAAVASLLAQGAAAAAAAAAGGAGAGGGGAIGGEGLRRVELRAGHGESLRSASVVGFSLVDSSGRDVARARRLAERGLEEESDYELEAPLHLRFSAHGKDFAYHLHRNPSPIAPGAIIRQETDNGTIVTTAQESFVFSSPGRDAVLHISEGGHVHGLVSHGNSYYDVFMDADGKALEVNESLVAKEHESAAVVATDNRTASAPGRRTSVPTMWENCYAGQDKTKVVSMGIAIGSKAQKNLQEHNLPVQDFVNAILAKTNMLYHRQMNVVFSATELYVANSLSSHSWNQGSNCPMEIVEQLKKFSDTELADKATWQLIDDCFPGSGVVGVAWGSGTVCLTMRGATPWGSLYRNRGVTWLYRRSPTQPEHPIRAWTTFAHEVGHNFAAKHPFDAGQGSAGGIMDYDDGTLNGYFQFDPARKPEVCGWLDYLVRAGCSHMTNLQPTCGNGILEPGEACDCKKGGHECDFCCNCKLEEGKQCSPGGTWGSGCCTDNGLFEAVGTKCDDGFGAKGYCFQGYCRIDSNCQITPGGEYSRRNSPNDCEYLCKVSGGESTVTTASEVLTVFPLGTPCGSNGLGKCESDGGKSRQCKKDGQVFVSVAAPVGPTVAPKPPVAGSAKHNVSGCVGFADQAFVGFPDIYLPPNPVGASNYSFEACSQACAAKPTCGNFIHSEAKGICELWTPVKQPDDLVHIPGYDTYVCEGKATDFIPDCERFSGDLVLPPVGASDVPDLGCPSCQANGAACGDAANCGGFTLAQCNAACLGDPRCYIFVFGSLSNVAGYCELWSTNATLRPRYGWEYRRRLTAEDESNALSTFNCPCRGEGNLCDCHRSTDSKVRVGCRCSDTATTNECGVGMYCLPGGTCANTSNAVRRRLATCEKEATGGGGNGATPATGGSTDTNTGTVYVFDASVSAGVRAAPGPSSSILLLALLAAPAAAATAPLAAAAAAVVALGSRGGRGF